MQFSKFFLRMKEILAKTILSAAIVWAAAVRPAAAVSVKHYFSAFVGPFNASVADFEYQLDGGRYAVYSNIYTHGVFDTLYPFAAKYATTGLVKPQGMQTETYSYQSQSRFSKRTKEVIYSSKGVPLQTISSKNGREKIKKIKNPGNIDDTTDLQTVVAKIARQYNQTRSCNAEMRVFDGKRRFNVIFKDMGREKIEAGKDSPYQGEAEKCSMYIDRLQEDGDDILWKLTSESPVYFWIMEDPDSGAPFIARVNVENTPLGEMNVYTTKIEVKE